MSTELLRELTSLVRGRGPTPPDGFSAEARLAHLRERVMSPEEITDLYGSKEFVKLVRDQDLDVDKVKKAIEYENDLEKLQIELVRMQRWVQDAGKRLVVLFEGRDAAGKGGTIRRFAEHLNPRMVRRVALQRPTEEDRGRWYFQRYVRHLPNRGQIALFDRSWYNRAVVEPVNGFCTPDEYERFMRQVAPFESLLVDDGILLVKFWFAVSRDVQQARIDARKDDPLKQWKLSALDTHAQANWDAYTTYKDRMLERTHTRLAPWTIVQADHKRRARLESIRYVLSHVNYPGHETPAASITPDPAVVRAYAPGA